MNAGAQLISIHDGRYPQRLREIFDPPLLLFAIGRTELMTAHSIAVVGTRRPRLTESPRPDGLPQISRGPDSLSSAAWRGGSIPRLTGLRLQKTAILAVLVRSRCPISGGQRKLYDDMSRRGLPLSEFPMGAPAYPQNFPIRNRIVSGISSGVLIVGAPAQRLGDYGSARNGPRTRGIRGSW